MSHLEEIREKLLKMFQYKSGPEVLLLPEDQMMIRKDTIANPAKVGFKDVNLVPGVNGYEIYVACRIQDASNERPAQRASPPSQPTVWDARSMSLQVDQEHLNTNWKVLNYEGQEVIVGVNCGSGVEVDEVNKILTVIAEILLL